ncbi:MAG: hypothetical protein M3R06_07700 [Chloroflexota bacterium]|nr:hypothetical protein [Chloroflexota bacterium]
MHGLIRKRLAGVAVTAGLASMFVIGGAQSLAQDATPAAGGTGGNHPAHIHEGNCDTLNPSPLFPLANVTMSMGTMASPEASPMASPAAGGSMMGSSMAIPAAMSVTLVEVGLADILAAEHAVNVHLSPEEAGTYIACGAIGGSPDANGDLIIGLAEQNDLGYSGIAWLHDNGDESTTVTIFLAQGLSGDMGSPMATPAS